MSEDYTSTTSDHDLTMAIPGDVGSVRARLVNAIQTLGYKVLSDQPLYAKRGSQCAAKWDCSLNVLDYPTTLMISLKQTNDAAVLATFNYEVKAYMRMTKGDRQTLAREAEAIAALTMERAAVSACRTCGTQATDESKFAGVAEPRSRSMFRSSKCCVSPEARAAVITTSSSAPSRCCSPC